VSGRLCQRADGADWQGLATDIGDTVKRIDGTEVPLLTPWQGKAANSRAKPAATPKPAAPKTAKNAAAPKTPAAPKVPVKKADAHKAKPADVAPKSSAAKSDVPKSDAPVLAAEGPGKKPRTMKAPRKSGPDDLKLIKGVGPKLEDMLHELGFFHFDQVAKWGPQEVAWVDQNLKGFKGRVSRDNWVVQAQSLARGEETAFSAQAQKDGRYGG